MDNRTMIAVVELCRRCLISPSRRTVVSTVWQIEPFRDCHFVRHYERSVLNFKYLRTGILDHSRTRWRYAVWRNRRVSLGSGIFATYVARTYIFDRVSSDVSTVLIAGTMRGVPRTRSTVTSGKNKRCAEGTVGRLKCGFKENEIHNELGNLFYGKETIGV